MGVMRNAVDWNVTRNVYESWCIGNSFREVENVEDHHDFPWRKIYYATSISGALALSDQAAGHSASAVHNKLSVVRRREHLVLLL